METIQLNLNFIWLILSAVLVFFMQAGFTALEAGLVRAKNSINVAIKNITDLLISSLVFSFVGFGLMFGATEGGWFGTDSFFFAGLSEDPWNWAFLFFQIVFAGTAATIVSGAIAERVKFGAYLVGTFLTVLIIYPIFGHWAWGSLWDTNQSGWLESIGFVDFAGSTVVHSVGGWVALAAIIVVGPRIGRYGLNGEVNTFKPSNIVLATLGIFILWLGWFGFNAGSTAIGDSSIAGIALNTHLGAVAGGLFALVISWIIHRHPHVEDILNGILAGLVSVTAGANVLTPSTAIIAGAIGGILVVLSIIFIDHKLKLDDAIGSVSVHGVCGAWGTLAVAIFGDMALLPAASRLEQIGIQSIGIIVCFVWAFGLGFFFYKSMSKIMKIRPSRKDEELGLNISEHGSSIALLDTIVSMNEIANEKGDLTKLIKVEEGEDTTELNLAFNSLLKTLNDLVHRVKNESSYVYDSSDLILKLTKQLKEDSSEQSETVNETYQVFYESDKNLEIEIEVENKVMASIQESFASVEEVGSQVNWIKAEVDGIGEFISKIGDLNKGVRTTMEQFNQNIQKINDFSSESTHVINSITDVTEQINLLSLNASIEAASAGEYGKGFAVVAKEIKNLAVQSQESTKQIHSIISNTVQTIEKGQTDIKDFTSKIESLNHELLVMPEKFRSMNSEVQSVNNIMNNLITHLQSVNEETSEIVKSKLDQKDNFKKMCSKIEHICKQIASNENAISGIEEKMAYMKKQSSSLQELLGQFHTTEENR